MIPGQPRAARLGAQWIPGFNAAMATAMTSRSLSNDELLRPPPAGGALRCIILSARPPFLLLALVCVALGLGLSLHTGVDVSGADLGLIALGAIAAHVSVNQLNEYMDFISGLDMRTRRTPFSGGSGALPAQPRAGRHVLLAALTALAITVGVGVHFALAQPWLMPVGLVGVLIVVAYTPWINRRPWLCLVAPGLGFGPVMVVGTWLALGGSTLQSELAASLVPFFLVNNLLLLNQYPDIEADRSVGRRHFPIRYGLTASNLIYGLFALASALVILSMVARDCLPVVAMVALAPLALSLPALAIAVRHARVRTPLLRAQALNVMSVLGTIAVLAAALLLSAPR